MKERQKELSSASVFSSDTQLQVKRYINASKNAVMKGIGGHFWYVNKYYLVVSVCYLPNKWQ